jgi:sugar phosphate isomerase/epimerase
MTTDDWFAAAIAADPVPAVPQVQRTRPALGRRAFVRALGGGVVTLAAGAGCARAETDAAEATARAEPVAAGTGGEPGLQLYTVRQEMERDLEATLARVAEIGYREVEFAGYFGRSPADVRAAVAAAGLRAPAAHIPLESFETALDATLDAALEAGHQLVIIPFVGNDRRTAEGYQRLADAFDEFGARASARGLRFGYHNHDFEFAPLGDTNGMEILLAGTDVANVGFELDLFWVRKGGGDALDLFGRFPGRFPAVHVKDMDGSPEGRMVNVGEGVIDFAAIFARAEQGGIQHYFVEHDQPEDPLESIRRSYQGLTQLLTG